MRLRGSVLIVVLGILAVLAVVGVAFVTMSSIESNTSANFALQAQFDLAADGAVDYVCQALIRDVWEFDTDPTTPPPSGSTYRFYSGRMLTGKFGTLPYDWPDPAISTTPMTLPTQDAFLATSWSSTTVPSSTTAVYSFRAATPTIKPYFLNTWNLNSSSLAYPGTGTPNSGTDGSPNNLGIPSADKSIKWYTPQNGLWIPELAAPYENGIIRASVTVQDHAAMVNLNAHGSPQYNATSTWSPYGQAAGNGYFVSDVAVAGVTWLSNFTTITNLLDGTRPTAPGRWGNATGPGNKRLGEIFMQNPALDASAGTSGSKDRPFTLDDEFELRRLTGTYAKSRLEDIIGSDLDSTPENTTATKVASRMNLTTVGWNAEVIPAQSACTPKCDLNLAGVTGIAGAKSVADALKDGYVLDSSTSSNLINQFSANVMAFKTKGKSSGSTNYFKQYEGRWGARRQAIMSKVNVKRTPNTPTTGKDTLYVRVQLYNPWYGNFAGDTNGGIDLTGHRIKIYVTGETTKEFVIDSPTGGNTTKVLDRATYSTGADDAKMSIVVTTNKTIDRIQLEAIPGPTPCIDQITSASLGTSYPTTKYRPFGVYDEPRAADDTDNYSKVTVLYVKNWADGTDASWNTLQGGTTAVTEGNGIPIRFPHSVPLADASGDDAWKTTEKGPLPPYYNATDTTAKSGVFKAFLRVGDLNQVLCPATETEASAYWPWIPRVASRSGVNAATAPTLADEQAIKWDWWKTGTDQTAYTGALWDQARSPQRQYRRHLAANVFCVDSPWLDGYDNDGDGKKDLEDTANTTDTGRFCGREIRVAGRLNINTATEQALKALGVSFTGITSESTYTPILTNRNTLKGYQSPVQILADSTIKATPSETPNKFLGGPIEKRDYPYTLISNIATVRSDTFSIYGTVQYLYPPSYTASAATTSLAQIKIVRSRRFWALIDRSPSLSNAPTTATFVRPRVMNFQWLD